MKFTCEKALLASAISIVSRTVSTKNSISALEGILVQAENKVSMTGYNLETGITVHLDADISETGKVVFPARLIFDIVRKLPDDMVTIQVDENNKAHITGGISSFSIAAASAEEYPELPEVDSDMSAEIPQKELKNLISGTIFSVSDNMTRPIHTGCLFEITKEEVICVAVDGYRMALRRWIPENGTERSLKFVAPAAALKEVEKILSDTDEPCTLYLGTKHLQFKIGEAILVCRLLEGEFLDWKRVLPQNNPIKMAANVTTLTDSVERVGLIISEKLKSPVRCLFGKNQADFRTVSTIGEAHDVCTIAGDGQDLEIGFNCHYLLDALHAIEDEEVSLELVNGLSPLVLNPCDGSKKFSYMVLPVRLKAGE